METTREGVVCHRILGKYVHSGEGNVIVLSWDQLKEVRNVKQIPPDCKYIEDKKVRAVTGKSKKPRTKPEKAGSGDESDEGVVESGSEEPCSTERKPKRHRDGAEKPPCDGAGPAPRKAAVEPNAVLSAPDVRQFFDNFFRDITTDVLMLTLKKLGYVKEDLSKEELRHLVTLCAQQFWDNAEMKVCLQGLLLGLSKEHFAEIFADSEAQLRKYVEFMATLRKDGIKSSDACEKRPRKRTIAFAKSGGISYKPILFTDVFEKSIMGLDVLQDHFREDLATREDAKAQRLAEETRRKVEEKSAEVLAGDIERIAKHKDDCVKARDKQATASDEFFELNCEANKTGDQEHRLKTFQAGRARLKFKGYGHGVPENTDGKFVVDPDTRLSVLERYGGLHSLQLASRIRKSEECDCYYLLLIMLDGKYVWQVSTNPREARPEGYVLDESRYDRPEIKATGLMKCDLDEAILRERLLTAYKGTMYDAFEIFNKIFTDHVTIGEKKLGQIVVDAGHKVSDIVPNYISPQCCDSKAHYMCAIGRQSDAVCGGIQNTMNRMAFQGIGYEKIVCTWLPSTCQQLVQSLAICHFCQDDYDKNFNGNREIMRIFQGACETHRKRNRELLR